MKTAKTFLEQLLEQETALTDEQYQAHRDQVNEGIRKVQRAEKAARVATQAAWVVAAIVFVAGGIVDFQRDRLPETLRLGLIVATALCMACAGALTLFYLINYRPRLRNAEQHAMLLSLERQLHDLRARMGHDQRKADSGNDA